jgi:hypothetical protein
MGATTYGDSLLPSRDGRPRTAAKQRLRALPSYLGRLIDELRKQEEMIA